MQEWITALSNYSATRERVLEHRFLADVCGELWRRGEFGFAVSRSEVDNSGYDVIIEACGVQRHIQLKAMHSAAKRRSFDIQTRLSERLNACVILMIHHPQSLVVEAYRWFGQSPGEGLPDLGEKITRHSKGNALGYKAARPALRDVPITSFEPIGSPVDLVDRLFGTSAGLD
jgi:hypothetical protein